MKFICLLLKSSKKRTEHVKTHLQKKIPELEIFYAVEGKTNELEYRLGKRTINEKLTNFCRRGQIACLLSHVEIWKKIVNENLEECVIIEDDSLVSDDFIIKFNQIYNLLPKDSEFLYLYVHPDCKKETENKILTPGYFTYGTVAYYIKNSLAKEFITFFENHIFHTVDESIAWYLNHHKKKYFCVTENLVETGGTLYFQRKDETKLLGSEISETPTFKNSKAIISFFIDLDKYICFPCCKISDGYFDDTFNETSKDRYLENDKIVGFNSNGIVIEKLSNEIEIDINNNLYIKKSYLYKNK
jgi:GR25 family glycosyltransferase involved in LPS biosynthesis